MLVVPGHRPIDKQAIYKLHISVGYYITNMITLVLLCCIALALNAQENPPLTSCSTDIKLSRQIPKPKASLQRKSGAFLKPSDPISECAAAMGCAYFCIDNCASCEVATYDIAIVRFLYSIIWFFRFICTHALACFSPTVFATILWDLSYSRLILLSLQQI